MSDLSKQLPRENLHHAYLLLGDLIEIKTELTEILSDRFGEGTLSSGNPDYLEMIRPLWSIGDSRFLKEWSARRAVERKVKIALIAAPSFMPQAQNALLKTLEEPAPATHFFIVAPQIGLLLPTVLSRCSIIDLNIGSRLWETECERFLKADLPERYLLIKELLAIQDEGEKIGPAFLNALLEAFRRENSSLTKPENLAAAEAITRAAILSTEAGGSLRLLLEHLAAVVPVR